MTRTPFAFHSPDISALARHLHQDLSLAPVPPSHLTLLNLLARATGFRNFQHFRASAKAGLALSAPANAPADHSRVQAALRYFDGAGRLKTWPAKTNLQHLCLWGLWSRLPSATEMTERQISAHLTLWHDFGDPAILRRTLCELKLVQRSADCRAYQRIEQAPSPEARALIRHLHVT